MNSCAKKWGIWCLSICGMLHSMDAPDVNKAVILFVGPTMSGKSTAVKTLRKYISDNLKIQSQTYTLDNYIATVNKAEELSVKLAKAEEALLKARADEAKKTNTIYLDELKIARRKSAPRNDTNIELLTKQVQELKTKVDKEKLIKKLQDAKENASELKLNAEDFRCYKYFPLNDEIADQVAKHTKGYLIIDYWVSSEILRSDLAFKLKGYREKILLIKIKCQQAVALKRFNIQKMSLDMKLKKISFRDNIECRQALNDALNQTITKATSEIEMEYSDPSLYQLSYYRAMNKKFVEWPYDMEFDTSNYSLPREYEVPEKTKKPHTPRLKSSSSDESMQDESPRVNTQKEGYELMAQQIIERLGH